MRLITCGALGLALLAMPGVASAARCTDDAAVTTAREAVAVNCPCDSFDNHGQYMKCVTAQVNTMAANNNLPKECKGEVVSCAAHSTCGKSGAVTCCRVDSRGRVKCSIKSNASKCKAAHGGVACVGSAASCCDSCGAGSADGAFTCGGSTTTSTTPVTTSSSSTSVPTTSTAAPTTSSTEAPTTTSTVVVVVTTSSTSTTLAGSPSGAFSE